jgi:hypothetical protein
MSVALQIHTYHSRIIHSLAIALVVNYCSLNTEAHVWYMCQRVWVLLYHIRGTRNLYWECHVGGGNSCGGHSLMRVATTHAG